MAKVGNSDLDIREALYAGADATRDLGTFSWNNKNVPSDGQVSKFKSQVIRFLEALPEEAAIFEVLEELDHAGEKD